MTLQPFPVRRRADRTVVLAFALCAAALTLQLLPLPPGIASRLGVTLGAAQPGVWRPISQHPAATWTALAWFGAAAAVFFAVTAVLTRVSAAMIVSAVLAASVGAAALGIAQRIGWGVALGLPPADLCTAQFGAFANANHFSGWMLMAIPCGVGLLCGLVNEGAGRATLVALTLALAALVVSLFLTQSRAGIGCFALTAFAFLVLIGRERTARDRTIAVAAVTALLVGGVAVMGPAALAVRFGALDVGTIDGRLQPWTTAVEIARAFPIAGAGLNTYARIAPRFEPPAMRHLDAAHNDYLQLAAEGGLLLLIPAALATLALGRAILRRFRASNDDAVTSWIRAGAVIALLAVACQEVVDFSLQVPVNALLCAAVLAIASHAPFRGAPHFSR